MNLKYRGAVHCASTIVKEEGVSALWRGVMPTMFRNGSNQAFNFMTYNFLSAVWLGKAAGDGQVIPMWKTATAGLIAAAVGPICNSPMDVIKTRLMAQVRCPVACIVARWLAGFAPSSHVHSSPLVGAAQKVVPGGEVKYRGIVGTATTIAKEEGVLVLWRGLGPRLARVAPGQAITWTGW